MLLSEPKPFYMQQSISMMTGRKDSSLARLAVLNQLDMDMDMDSPERGNTPDSLEGSPGPMALAPSLKKKRMFKKQNATMAMAVATVQDDSDNSSIKHSKFASQSKKHHVSHKRRVREESENFAMDVIDDDDEASAPTSSAAAAATTVKSKAISGSKTSSSGGRPPSVPSGRPRIHSCKFEGCGKSFMDKFHLDRHEARHVTEEIVCGIDGCTKAYPSISTVRRHQSIVHKKWKEEAAAAAAAAAASATTVGARATTTAATSADSSDSSTRNSSPLRETMQETESSSQRGDIAVD